MDNYILQVKNLKKSFPIKGGLFGKKIGEVKAVDGVSFDLKEGETLGLVGESGCGKSTTGRLLMRLIEPTDGTITFDGHDITDFSQNEMRKMRKEIQMVFQDPFASLNPRHTVERILEEPLIVHGVSSKQERLEKIYGVLETVGLSKYHAKRFPHQFSGGQRQRIGIARALMTRPKLVIADEPVSALDVSIQAQVLNLMKDLQEEFQLTYIFIAHDLGVVKQISDRIGVMYLGSIVEIASSENLYENPLHPYTQALLSSVPIPDPNAEKKTEFLLGEIPSASNPPSGCLFHTRCGSCMDICKTTRPSLTEVKSGQYTACHLYK